MRGRFDADLGTWPDRELRPCVNPTTRGRRRAQGFLRPNFIPCFPPDTVAGAMNCRPESSFDDKCCLERPVPGIRIGRRARALMVAPLSPPRESAFADVGSTITPIAALVAAFRTSARSIPVVSDLPPAPGVSLRIGKHDRPASRALCQLPSRGAPALVGACKLRPSKSFSWLLDQRRRCLSRRRVGVGLLLAIGEYGRTQRGKSSPAESRAER